MRRGEDLFGRNIRVADDAVFGGGGAADPFMAVGKPDHQIRAGRGIMQRAEALGVQPIGPIAQRRIVLQPRRDRIISIDPRSRKDRIREFCHRDVVFVAGEDLLGPGQARIGDDVPVDVETDDLLQRRLIGHGIGLAGARDLGRIFAGQQHRIVADDGEPRGVGGERLRHALIEPARGAIETVVGSEAITRQRHRLVRQDRRYQPRARLIGMLDDLPHQRQRRRGRGQQQVLSRLQVQPDLDGDFRQAVEFDRIDRGRDVAFVDGHGNQPVADGISTIKGLMPGRSRPPRGHSMMVS